VRGTLKITLWNFLEFLKTELFAILSTPFIPLDSMGDKGGRMAATPYSSILGCSRPSKMFVLTFLDVGFEIQSFPDLLRHFLIQDGQPSSQELLKRMWGFL
jgi:hypothetical protein